MPSKRTQKYGVYGTSDYLSWYWPFLLLGFLCILHCRLVCSPALPSSFRIFRFKCAKLVTTCPFDVAIIFPLVIAITWVYVLKIILALVEFHKGVKLDACIQSDMFNWKNYGYNLLLTEGANSATMQF